MCLALGSLAGCGGSSDAPALVAQAGDYRFTVDEAVTLLVDEEGLPTQVPVVRSLAELWVDYTLLAEAAADDSTFADLDFAALVRPLVQQLMVLQLRDSVVQVDTSITTEALRALYEADAPELQLHARHIVLSLPLQATEAQRDSVRTRLQQIRGQILAGTPFEELARTYSQDPGTAPVGGDLGFFGRGEMVAPFEEAVLALEPGEVSDVVQTPLGLHLIRLEERREQSFDDVATGFRSFVQEQRLVTAESTFIAGLEGRSVPTINSGALDVARELARAPQSRLSGSAARRALVQWSGGAYTAGELLDLLRSEQGPLRDEVLRGNDEDLGGFLLAQARRKLLVDEARRSGFEPTPAAVDSLTDAARIQLRDATRSLGLLRLDQAPGEARERAIARAVRSAIADNLSGATAIVPLGVVGYQLREGVPIAIFDSGVGQVLLRVAQTRAARPPSALEESQIPPTQPADTVAR
ncbi:MAG: peptidylprolyl isomerase [Gemmatimonadota bacterium]|nr:peptidylprolyl isomerase [Gemmatimonadota bacterium]